LTADLKARKEKAMSDQLEARRDLATYESRYSRHVNFREKILNIKMKVQET